MAWTARFPKLRNQRQFAAKRAWTSLCSVVALWVVLVAGCRVVQATIAPQSIDRLETLDRNARERYEAGDYEAAIEVLQQSIEVADDGVVRSTALRNLALVYHAMGNLDAAHRAVADSLTLLTPDEHPKVFAQVLEVRGQLEQSSGQIEQAIDTWAQAARLYAELDDSEGITRVRVAQSRGMQLLGLYRQAVKTLSDTRVSLAERPDTRLKALAFQSLGEALRVVGDLEQSQAILTESLAIAQQLDLPDVAATVLASLGNTARVRGEYDVALEYYRRSVDLATTRLGRVQARLNQMGVVLERGDVASARAIGESLSSDIDRLPVTQAAIYARIHWSDRLLRSSDRADDATFQLALQSLVTATNQARQLGDLRTESHALGHLGRLYEKRQQWDEARELTQEALWLAQRINADDIIYQWQWQLGRVLKAKADLADRAEPYRREAIAAYSQAVETLKTLRSDLVAISSDVQFSFRDRVEPVYRELVGLLLQPDLEPSQEDLRLARQTLEALQLAELDNFFRDACLDAEPANIDEVDDRAAAIYAIVLPDRLETIASIPGQPLRRYTTNLPKPQIDAVLYQALEGLVNPRRIRNLSFFLEPSGRIYDWLVRPIEADLAERDIETLVFVLDGLFRKLPMSTLYDGERYLVERYAVALTPGLQLLTSTSSETSDFQLLLGGLSEARQGFEPLPGVEYELERIGLEVPTAALLNQRFTEDNIQQLIATLPFPVVHFATHGQFSSSAENTFLLTWNGRLNAREFAALLESDVRGDRAIELLVLSACQTAAGDDRAALGLAGIAVRAGARSTVASLWYISDRATAQLMSQFYRELGELNTTKAQSLRAAQRSILEREEFSHPYYWGAFVLVGNWL